MNLSVGYPYDLVRNGIPYDYPKLQSDCKAGIVVMGGGISGALVAYYLMKAGMDCTVIDGRSIGLGSTCASTSFLQYEIDQPLYRLSEMMGEANAERAYHLCGKAIHDLQKISKEIKFTFFQYCNSVYFAAAAKDIQNLQYEFTARQKSGFDVQWMESAEIERSYGLVAPAAIVSSLAAHTNAYTFTHALHQYNIKKGMKVYDRTPVVKIDHQKRGVTLVTAEGHKINCKKLVYATGYESIRYIDKKIVQLSASYATVSEQFDNENFFWKDRALLWNTAKPYLYTRITSDQRILAGGGDVKFTSSRKMDSLIKKKSEQLCKDFQHYFPSVPFKKEFSWAGVFGSTKDGLPFIGNYKKLSNSFFALGFGGNGITFSAIAANMLKDILAGRRNKDASLFSFERI
jgi:glycine/D-amino acid oxidase-like deaminating enzyme